MSPEGKVGLTPAALGHTRGPSKATGLLPGHGPKRFRFRLRTTLTLCCCPDDDRPRIVGLLCTRGAEQSVIGGGQSS